MSTPEFPAPPRISLEQYASAILDPAREDRNELDIHIEAVHTNLSVDGFVEETVVSKPGLCAVRWWEITGGTPTPDQLTAVEAVENLIDPTDRERAAEAVRPLLEELADAYDPANVVMVRAPLAVIREHIIGADSLDYSPDTMVLMFLPRQANSS